MKQYSFDEFPSSPFAPEGMKTLNQPMSPFYPQVIQNVCYAVKDGQALHLTIIVPAHEETETKHYPLIMYTQGSAFKRQNLTRHLVPLIEVAKHGYVVAIVEYRPTPTGIFPAQIKDLKTATRYMLNHAFEYSVDPYRYACFGDSSGAYASVMACVTGNMQAFSDEDVRFSPLHYRACVDFYGPIDFSRMQEFPTNWDHESEKSPTGLLFGGVNIRTVPDLLEKSSALNYIDSKKLPPFLIMHGKKDRMVPFSQSVMLYEKLRQTDHRADFYALENCDHGSDAFFTPYSLTIVLDFLSKNLKKGN